jgi:phosphatidylinositol alpha-1,6-mannosyltransferase
MASLPPSPFPNKLNMSPIVPHRYLFIFIEVLGCEGGIQSYVQDVLRAYTQIPEPPPADVFLLRDGPQDLPTFEPGPLRFHYFKSKQVMVSRIWLTLALIGRLIGQRPSHVFCGHINLVSLISRLCQLFNVPYTVLTYGKEVWYPLPSAERQALVKAQSIWTISRYSRDLACQANQVSPDKVHLLPCVVDGQKFTPAPPSPTLQAHYGLQEALVLMTVARLWPGDIYKGVDVTIRALPAITRQFPQVKYLVIGRGDDQPRLAQLARDLGVAEQVVFAGFVSTAALVDHYRLADVYVMPSKEGFGIVYLEAMACGVPVIAGNDDGSADPLQDGRLGWQVSHRDPAAVADACIAALSGHDPRCEGTWLRQETLKRFSAKALTHQLAQLLAPTALLAEPTVQAIPTSLHPKL